MEDRPRVLSGGSYEETFAGAICREDVMTPGVYKMMVYSR
jgi:hypothetical protein